MKFFLPLCVLCVWCTFSRAQDYSHSWEEEYSYFQITDLDYGNGKIYAATENAIFTTQIGNGYQKKITTLQGLSGNSISALHYSKAYNSLLIGFDNGLIQIYNLTEESVKTLINIEQKPTLDPEEKKINNFYEVGDRAFIATNYGVTELNLSGKEFGDTYYIGDLGNKLAVNAVAVLNNKLYAATEGGGIRYTPVDNPDIVDYDEWMQTGGGVYKNIVRFGESLYVLNEQNTLSRLNGSALNQVLQFGQTVHDINITQDYMTVTFPHNLKVFKTDLSLVTDFSTNQIPTNFKTGLTYHGSIYGGDAKYGLIETSLEQAVGVNFLSPNGPLRNDIFAMDLIADNIWVAYGEYNFYYNPYPLRRRGISHYTNKHWTNIPYDNLPQNRSITSVTVNPANPKQVFFGSYRDGLMEVDDEEITNFYTVNNSNLEPTDNNSEQPDAVRLGPGKFDRQGNFWFANALSADGLIKLPKGGGANSFVKYDISDIMNNTENNNGFGALTIDQTGNIYMGTYRDGVLGYNPSQGTFAKIKGDEGQGNLPDNYVSSLAMDNNDQLWIGTKKGLRVLYGPSVMFDNPNASANNIVFRDEDGVAQELFSGLNVTSIVVDGNNNKWIGSTAGVYYISDDGQKTMHHFTTENSPLPSNNINAIRVDGQTGKVYIATQKGLLVYRGSATSSADDLQNVRAFPNPVRPHYEGLVTIDGLMKDADVKITDIEGNLVYEEVSDGGSIQWDTTAFGKYKVASGVYLVMVTSDDQSKTKVAKIMIVR